MEALVTGMDTGVLQEAVNVVEKANDEIPPCPW
jgi:hypothetical protein